MNRRTFLGLTSTALAGGLAGCTSSSNNASGLDSSQAGGLIAEDVDSAPSNATVIDATSGRIANVDAVQTVLKQATSSDRSYALLALEPKTFETVKPALDPLPYYDGDNGLSGYYLQYNNDTLLLYPYYRK